MMNYIVRVSKGTIDKLGDDRYEFYELHGARAESPEEAARQVLEKFGIRDPENYEVVVC